MDMIKSKIPNLTKEFLEKEAQTKSFSKIAKELGVTSPCIQYQAKKFGIKSVYNQPSSIVLTDEQRQIIIGGVLGDGSIDRVRDTKYYREHHSIKQEEYLRWKYFKLKNVCHSEPSYTQNNTSISFRMATHAFTDELYDKFYDGVGCHPAADLEQMLSPLVLAIWYQDDGNLIPKRKTSRLYTNTFTERENYFIQECLFKKFKLISRVYKNGKYFHQHFDKENTAKLVSVITPFVHDTMKYKIHI